MNKVLFLFVEFVLIDFDALLLMSILARHY